uniref:Uncharacterized protein n=1 Tax=Timema cristinae TaxID=61476 RepID=A0A7R9CU58_TIMCR|nr:unnamed protein product [Timema cristinae]
MAAEVTPYETLYHQQNERESPEQTESTSSLPPSYHHTLPSSERGAPPTYEEAIDPNVYSLDLSGVVVNLAVTERRAVFIPKLVMRVEKGVSGQSPNRSPPPSYDSLFGRVREAHKASKGVFEFLKNVIILLLGTIGCTVILGVTIVVPICMIVIGAIYLNDCPQGEYIPIYLLVGVGCTVILGVTIVVPICMIVIGAIYLNDCPQGEYIPIYLLVGGGFGVLKQLLHLSARVRQREEEQEEERLRQSPTQTLINCFMLGWFIIGSVWVYKEFEPNYDPMRGKHCNRTLYLFAFWLITSVYIVLGVITMCLCSISVASIAFQREV